MKRIIYLSIPKAAASIQSKDRVEALAFAIQIKAAYVSSNTRYNKTELKAMFHIGHIKLSKLIKTAIEHNYVRIENGYIIANRIKDDGLNIKLPIEQKIYTNKQIVELIQKSVILNHISKITFLNDTNRQAGDSKLSYKERRKAINTIYKYAVKMPEGLIGLSYIRIAQICNITRLKAIELVKELLGAKVITRTFNFIKTGIKCAVNDKNEQLQYKNAGQNGYLRKIDGNFCIQSSNIFGLVVEGMFLSC